MAQRAHPNLSASHCAFWPIYDHVTPNVCHHPIFNKNLICSTDGCPYQKVVIFWINDDLMSFTTVEFMKICQRFVLFYGTPRKWSFSTSQARSQNWWLFMVDVPINMCFPMNITPEEYWSGAHALVVLLVRWKTLSCISLCSIDSFCHVMVWAQRDQQQKRYCIVVCFHKHFCMYTWDLTRGLVQQ